MNDPGDNAPLDDPPRPAAPDGAIPHPAIDRYARHVNPAFIKLLGIFGYGRVFTRAGDVWLWDHQGRRYLDLLASFGATPLGHNHPALTARMIEHLQSGAFNFCHVGPSPVAADLGEALATLAGPPLQLALFSCSGGEAVEAGMKLARAATHRSGFIACEGGFHGTTLGTLSIMGHPRLRGPFEPLLSGCSAVPFGDLDRLEQALAPKKAAAFIVEPILGEGGVILPPPGYLKEAQRLCTRSGTLLILDEVQTGLGRTGAMFAYQAEGFVPDVLVLAKALSGGLAPISATLVSEALFRKAYGSPDRFDLHSSTFGGAAFSCAAALATLEILRDEHLVENSAARGRQLLEGLKQRLSGHPLVRDIRGRGLLVGIELGPTEAGWVNRLAPSLVSAVSKNVFGQWASLRLLERGVVCQPASQQWNVLRIEPPLTIREAEIELAIDAVAGVLADYPGLAPLLREVSARVGTQFVKGWSFG